MISTLNFKSSFAPRSVPSCVRLIRPCHSSLSRDMVIGRSERRRAPFTTPSRSRKLNSHSARCDRGREPRKETVTAALGNGRGRQRGFITRGERWKLRMARAEIGKDAGCSRWRRTAKTTTLYPQNSDYYRSRRLCRLALLSFCRIIARERMYPLISRRLDSPPFDMSSLVRPRVRQHAFTLAAV